MKLLPRALLATTAVVGLVSLSRQRPKSTRNEKRQLGLITTPSLPGLRDPSSVQTNPLGSSPSGSSPTKLPAETKLLPDGTLLEVRKAGKNPCDFLHLGDRVKRIHYHFDECVEGQLGNRMGEYYGRMWVANAWRVPFTLSCGDPNDTSYYQNLNRQGREDPKVSVLKLLSKHNNEPGPVPTDIKGYEYSKEGVCNTCNPPSWFCKRGLDMMADTMRQDMKSLSETEWVRDLQPDDAVIHLRLGDSLNGERERDEGIGLFPHQTYSRLLLKAQGERGRIGSIGIVTAPFEAKDGRKFDRRYMDRSKLVALDLVEHLRKVFPRARITIHNGSGEIPLASLARLVQARKAAVCGSSTFWTEAVLATNGIGFIYRSMKHNPWGPTATLRYNNTQAYEAPRLANHYIAKLSDEDMLLWLRTQDPNVGCIAITEPPLIRNANPTPTQHTSRQLTRTTKFKSTAELYRQDKNFQISRDYGLVYVHIPKTGGSTIEQSQIFQEKRQIAFGGRSHSRIEYMMHDAEERRIDNFTTATTIRHPCDRFLSAFFYVKTLPESTAAQRVSRYFNMNSFNNVQDWVAWLNNTPDMWRQLKKKFFHFVPMTRWTMYDDGSFGIDVVICQEQWNEGVSRLFDTLDRPVPDSVLSHKLQTSHPASDSLDDTTMASIMREYAMDACLFGYGEWAIKSHDRSTCIGATHHRQFFTRRYSECQNALRDQSKIS